VDGPGASSLGHSSTIPLNLIVALFPFALASLDRTFFSTEIMDFNTGTSHEAQHLCVLVHGSVSPFLSECTLLTVCRLWGNPNHLEVMARCLRAKHAQESLHILVAKRNSGNFTYDGIELGGERVCQEIEEEIEKLAKAGQEIKRLSMIGYSLGGLVARYAIGLLHSKGFFEKITPVVCSSLKHENGWP
jgi:Putative serine esterase (DUF676)